MGYSKIATKKKQRGPATCKPTNGAICTALILITMFMLVDFAALVYAVGGPSV